MVRGEIRRYAFHVYLETGPVKRRVLGLVPGVYVGPSFNHLPAQLRLAVARSLSPTRQTQSTTDNRQMGMGTSNKLRIICVYRVLLERRKGLAKRKHRARASPCLPGVVTRLTRDPLVEEKSNRGYKSIQGRGAQVPRYII